MIIANFSHETLHDYRLQLPVSGHWIVRFNSTWKGYSSDFHEYLFNDITTNDSGEAILTLPPFAVVIASQE
jgi:1,4-alpha-glucan branching enzyme